MQPPRYYTPSNLSYQNMSASTQAFEALIPHVSITQAVGAPADISDGTFDDLVRGMYCPSVR